MNQPPFSIMTKWQKLRASHMGRHIRRLQNQLYQHVAVNLPESPSQPLIYALYLANSSLLLLHPRLTIIVKTTVVMLRPDIGWFRDTLCHILVFDVITTTGTAARVSAELVKLSIENIATKEPWSLQFCPLRRFCLCLFAGLCPEFGVKAVREVILPVCTHYVAFE